MRELERDGGVDAGGDPRPQRRGAGGKGAAGAGAPAGGEQRGAVDEEAVAAGDPAADLPLDTAVHPDVEQHVARGDVLPHGVRRVLRQGHRVARHHRRPHRRVPVALVHRRHRHRHRHRLVAVRGERVQGLVVHAHPLVRVPRHDRDLRALRRSCRPGRPAGSPTQVVRPPSPKRGVQINKCARLTHVLLTRRTYLEVEGERRVAEVDGAELHVLEVEGRLGGAQREVDDQHDEADHGGEREDAGGDGAAAAAEDPVAVVLLLAHGETELPDLLLLRRWTGLGVGSSAGCLVATSVGLCDVRACGQCGRS
jgi:hypothetical protein